MYCTHRESFVKSPGERRDAEADTGRGVRKRSESGRRFLRLRSQTYPGTLTLPVATTSFADVAPIADNMTLYHSPMLMRQIHLLCFPE
jgi:hypothetical protein